MTAARRGPRSRGDGLPPPPLGRIGLGIAPSNPKRIYATIETADQGTLWRSDDGGGTWQRVSSDRGINNRARYFSRLGVVADNPDEVYFLTQRLMRSTDGGKTTAAVPEVYPDQHDIWIDPLNANRQIVANDRYVNISDESRPVVVPSRSADRADLSRGYRFAGAVQRVRRAAGRPDVSRPQQQSVDHRADSRGPLGVCRLE